MRIGAMRRGLGCLLTGLGLFYLGGCGDSTSPTDGGAVQGRVQDEAGAVVPAVTVRLQDPGASDEIATQPTDVDGAYRFEGLDPGDYQVRIDVPSAFALGGQTNPVPVTVQGRGTTSADFTLQLVAAGTITGTVVDDNDAPVADATAELRTPGAEAGFRTARSDSAGAYQFDRVPARDYDLFLSAPGGFAVSSENPIRIRVEDGATADSRFVLIVSSVSFSENVQPVFTASCALSGCHGGVNPRPTGKGMSLEPGEAWANIVNVSAFQLPSMDRIEPGEPDDSYLIHKIQGTQAQIGGAGDQMPFGGVPLDQQTIDLIRKWVAEGAPNN